ncbi:MAG: succinate dehydrogenase assembly factor 2 [Methylobacter sp.]|nr:succinate dehydrogenase assembly factor 2 [Methylobacter sp.]
MDQLARLRWQCRRGTKELDFLLTSYLESGYLLADKKEKAFFTELLMLEDDKLIEVLLGDEPLVANKTSTGCQSDAASQCSIKRLFECVQKGYTL